MCFFNDTATTEIYTLALHDALPIFENMRRVAEVARLMTDAGLVVLVSLISPFHSERKMARSLDRKSTRLNSSHANISYAVFCLKKNNTRCDIRVAAVAAYTQHLRQT